MCRYLIIYKDDEKLKSQGLYDNRTKVKFAPEALTFKAGEIDFNMPSLSDSDIVEKLGQTDFQRYYGNITSKSNSDNVEPRKFIFETNSGEYFRLNDKANDALVSDHKDTRLLTRMFMIGTQVGESSDEYPVFETLCIFKRIEQEKPQSVQFIAPTGIPGLDQLLFPQYSKNINRNLREDADFKVGFTLPEDEKSVVPRTILIKGAPGAGKTTIAVQMLIAMARDKIKCTYWCSNDSREAITNMATSYKFCDENEICNFCGENGSISIVSLDNTRNFKNIFLHKDIKRSLQHDDVLFVDSLNISQFDREKDRPLLWETFYNLKKSNCLAIVLLEDYGSDGSEDSRQLIADCEFMADVVIELTEDQKLNYQTRYLRIAKKHFSRHIAGKHLYKISPPQHSLRNVSKYTGIVVYPSIHHYISSSRAEMYDRQKENREVHTGITHLDSILTGAYDHDLNGKTISSNSCIVISGPKGLHKLALGYNILLGGLWEINSNGTDPEPGKDVLIVQLAEESDVDIEKVAMACNTHLFMRRKCVLPSLDNGQILKWKYPCQCKQRCKNREMFNKENNYGQKIHFNRKCVELLNKNAGDSNGCRKIVIAGFRPGCITPEEFISSLSSMMTDKKTGEIIFSRVLFHSTAHLQSGFPLLSEEPLFLRALTDFFKAKNIVSIFMDVRGDGSNKKLSYGLGSMADYHFHLSAFEEDELKFSNKLPPQALTLAGGWKSIERGLVWGKLEVENIMGKDYSRSAHVITVVPKGKRNNEIYICDTGTTSAYSPELVIPNN